MDLSLTVEAVQQKVSIYIMLSLLGTPSPLYSIVKRKNIYSNCGPQALPRWWVGANFRRGRENFRRGRQTRGAGEDIRRSRGSRPPAPTVTSAH